MPTVDKKAIVAEIKDRFTASSGVIMADYRGLSVRDMQALRVKVRAVGGEVKIYKNTLMELAVRELAMPSMDQLLSGPTAVVFVEGDPVAPAKAMIEFAKEHKQLEVKGGFIERSVLGAESMKAIAALPPREVLIAKLLGTLQAPATSFVRVLNGPVSAFARTLQAIADQKAASAA
ncbi:MAG: 50S ribosomal protein L10 [Actinomycetota bacterium]|nr:MAG: large subunit ribosomal protein [Actinomycetota bacterium]MDO8950082.1 50S ribosomal protein L10 [Actinomycetota bacterium]MDP3629859.1 50S ribosomal protein L10 [Actinomycetota bacterium]